LAVLLFAAFAIGSGFGSHAAPGQTFEYKFVYRCDEKKANETAAQGWELSAMSETAYGSIGVATCVFKRAK
jgi:hypothetical protein